MSFAQSTLTTQEAAELTGYTQTYIGRLLRAGRIKGIKLGHDWLAFRDSVLEFQREMQALGAEKHNPHREAGKK